METILPITRKPTLSYSWTVKDFRKIIYSKTFLTENICFPNRKKHFRLVLYPFMQIDVVMLTYVYAFFSASDVPNDEALICISILDSVGNKRLTTEGLSKTSNPGGDYYPQLTIKHDYLFNNDNDLLFEDKLTIYYEIFYGEDKLKISNVLNEYSFYDYSFETKSLTKSHHDYLSILPSMNEETQIDHSDRTNGNSMLMINFELGDKDFCVHKHILAAQSSYFADLFSKNLQLKRIKIEDIDAEVFQELICYIYNGSVSSMDRLARKLLKASKKFKITGLEQLCEELYNSELTIDSVGRTFLLADMHNVAETKTKCIEFMNKHSNKVMQTEGWKQIVDTYRMETMLDLVNTELAKIKIED